MTKLPTRESLGGLPSRPSRQIASIAVPGADPTGLGLEKLGRDLSGIGAKLSEQQDQFEYSNAHADLMKTSVELDTKYLNDTDYTTRPQRYSDDLDNFVKERAAKISNPQSVTAFLPMQVLFMPSIFINKQRLLSKWAIRTPLQNFKGR